MSVPTLTPAFIIPEGIGGGISGGGGNVGATAAGVVAAGVIAGGLAVAAAPVVAGLAAKASLLTAASPLGLLAVGTFLKGLQQIQDWGLVNYRPQPVDRPAQTGDELIASPGVNRQFLVGLFRRTTTTDAISCEPPGQVVQEGTSQNVYESYSVFGTGIRIGETQGGSSLICGTGGSVSPSESFGFTVLTVEGDGQSFARVASGAVTPSGVFNRRQETTVSLNGIFTLRDGVFVVGGGTETPELPQQVRPSLFPPTLPDAPALPAPAVPLETPVLPSPPDRRPLAPPVVIPRPGQQPARVPVPGPSPGPSPGPGPAPVPAQPAPLPVPGIGPLPLPAPLPVPVTPVEVVVVDGLPISGPGQAPAPNLVAIAQELGRLERKNEILMRRPENGGLGEAAENSLLNGLRELLEGLVSELLNDVDGGSFQLIRPCQAPGGGDPLPPVVVPYSGGTNATMAVLAKLDGIAGLIQAHKDVGQPTCVTPVFGEEVTVHFESE
jgi:hypothetical protein